MTRAGQGTAAAERSASIVREAAPAASCPAVEVAPGVWQLRAVVVRDEALRALLDAWDDVQISQPGAWERLREARAAARVLVEGGK